MLRLVLAALVVLAPAVHAEPRCDRVAYVEGGRGQIAPTVAQHDAAPLEVVPRFEARAEVFRPAPRSAPVARYLLHRALLR